MPEQYGIARFLRQAVLPTFEPFPRPPRNSFNVILDWRREIRDLWEYLFALQGALERDIEEFRRYLDSHQLDLSVGYDELARRLNELPNEVSLGFFQDNVAANQTNVALSNGMSTRGYCAPIAGSIIRIAVKSNDARSGGTLTVEPTINGAATGLTAVLDGTNTTTNFTLQDAGLDTFASGDNLGCRITTTAAWAPTTADIDIAVSVIFDGRVR